MKPTQRQIVKKALKHKKQIARLKADRVWFTKTFIRLGLSAQDAKIATKNLLASRLKVK